MRIYAIAFLLFMAVAVNAQYKNDNVSYKTVYLEDLCTTLKQQPGYLLLDVRSKGEYADTSQHTGANIGYLENAINIDVRELDKRLGELSSYKNKPVFVYCSHSQRSRRAAAMLAENGFTRVFNINEGLTGIVWKKDAGIGCAAELYGTKNGFSLIGPSAIVTLLRKPGKAIVYDLRGDSAFKGIASDEIRNSFGSIKGAIPINSEADMDQKLVNIPRHKTIILVDDFGETSMKVAGLMVKEGYTDVRVLLEGMEKWMDTAPGDCPGKTDFWIRNSPYEVITAPELEAWQTVNAGYLLVDVRDAAAFNNKAKEAYHNKGHIKNAVNIPAADLEKTSAGWSFPKDRPILLYDFSNQPETYKAARMLAGKGFTKVAVLSGGLFNLRWQAANIKGRENLFNWVVDIPAAGF
ncbi:rhodanese-like domain-containing protein [Flavihumibacter profundi]|uniref:rhodanese-like domain-containing protein n=1 Tax=Flavihumibacter profundi TaxID=2716883 RepID=UPI001CC7B8E9|nr:rhodanese-like domain-containing protein [Flavihumibacter profundi]MBZ5857839.1 rhodanese-like domain-containing protein [Flavihumibacter profundi]